MHARIQRIRHYLINTCKLEAEAFRIAIESMSVGFETYEQAMHEVVGQQLMQVAPNLDFKLSNEYTLSISISSYAGDIDHLIRQIAWLLHLEQVQPMKFTGLLELNNDASYDLIIDIKNTELHRNCGEEVRVC